MVLATKPRSMGSSWSGSFEFEEIIEEEEFYEEVVIEEDEEYEEIVIESPQGKKGRLQATQEEVDSMSLQNAKLYLAALPDAKGQTSVPATYSDDDYEYEEIEIPDEITPIRRSRRNSLFGAPSLDTLDEGSERSERSNTSAIHSPNTTKKKELGVILRNINENSIQEEPAEFSEQEPSKSEQAEGQNSKEAITGADLSQPEDQEDDGPHSENHLSQKEIGVDTHDELGKGVDTEPVSISPSRNINKSSKSIQSETTATTVCDFGSSTSLDIKHVFGLITPPESPRPSPSSASSRKRRSGSKNVSSSESSSKNNTSDDAPVHSPGSLAGDKKHSQPHRRRSSTKSNHYSDEEEDNRSVKSKSTRSRRSSSGREKKGSRSLSVEAEILQMLAAGTNLEATKKSSLEKAFEKHPKQREESDCKSTRSSRSSSRRRSSQGEKAKATTDKSKLVKESSSTKPSTLEDFLALMPADPKKSRDARSTVSASRRKSRTREENDNARDCRSVVGTESSKSGRPRARSARRPKKRESRGNDDDETSVASLSALGRRRARSSSVGRKGRLRRNRVIEEAEKANRRYQEEMAADAPPDPSSRRSLGSQPRSDRSFESRPSSGYSATSQGSSFNSSGNRSSSRRRSSDQEDDEHSVSTQPRLKREGSTGKSVTRETNVHAVSSDESGQEASQSPERRPTRISSLVHKNHSTSETNRSPEKDGAARRPSSDVRSFGAHSRRGSTGGSHPNEEGRHFKEKRRSSHTSEKHSHNEVDRGHIRTTSRQPDDSSRGDDNSMGEIDGNMSFSRTLDLARSLRSPMTSNSDSDNDLDEVDGHSSFLRTMDLARSLHQDDDSSSPRKSDGQRGRNQKPVTRDDSSKTSKSAMIFSPQRRSSKIEYISSQSAKRNESSHQKSDGWDKPPKTPRTPNDKRRDGLRKKHSSDDVLLTNDEGQKTPSSSKGKSRNQLHRTHSSRTDRDHGTSNTNSAYRSPRKSSRPKTPTTSSPPERSHPAPISRSYSESSPRRSSPSPMESVQRSPSLRTERKLPKTVLSAPPLVSPSPTPFERLSELEKVKVFLSEAEYNQKRSEILASI